MRDVHPPKPRLSFRIGITGHRPNKLSGGIARGIEIQLARVFSAITKAGNDILKVNRSIYADEPLQFRLVSGFAEGADQLAVSACPSGWSIEAILPFPKHEYLKDFSESADGSRDARAEFLESLNKASNITELPLPSPHRREQGYRNAGSYLLRQVDLLIAVWDGTAPKVGGTGAIARDAFEAGIPVIWISTHGNYVPRLITDFDEKGWPIASEADCTEGPLRSALSSIYDGPILDENSRNSPLKALKSFYDEVWYGRSYFPAYDFISRIANLRGPRVIFRTRSFSNQLSDWDHFLAALK
jgi:hypothetical protein